MSTADPARRRQRVRYLARALTLNPLAQSDELMRLRGRWLGFSGPEATQTSSTVDDLQERREQAAGVIRVVRERFWTVELNALHRRLASLNLEAFPDLKYAVHRLQVTADHRRDFPALSQRPNFDPRLFAAMKKVLVAAPRDAAQVKQRFLQTLGDKHDRRRARKMVQLLRRDYPGLYRLEEDWFDSIVDYQPRKAAKEGSGESVFGGFSFDGYGWLIWILILVVLRFVRMAMRD
ncbi:MAG: hypothetical protein DWQ34_04670 [Planctomycetota bacterium]|nr:MAG: hypothetical protein DWQ29_08475 [Planctomycetota bacterium]REJ96154.1 MAG: hypothetical protein DWQ34_04670 [Planctomycetota bacterium]REK28077.1 MAG: hypothetical protein DWQ41_06615 [Planctomycetota bacterium]REK37604.1 MAG: hypothetical protein DWQ45_06300 [Planctomycetota bacterium]